MKQEWEEITLYKRGFKTAADRQKTKRRMGYAVFLGPLPYWIVWPLFSTVEFPDISPTLCGTLNNVAIMQVMNANSIKVQRNSDQSVND